MKKYFLSIITILFCIFVSICFASKRPITINDLFTYHRFGSLELSPHGKWAAWTISSASTKKDHWISHIYLANLAKNVPPFQATSGENGESQPKFSPDGKMLAFLSKRTKKTQIYILPLSGGEAKRLTSFEHGVLSYRWENSEKILFIAREKTTFEEAVKKKKNDDAMVVESMKTFYPHRVFEIDIKSGKVRRITHNYDQIRSITISPDGHRMITTSIESPKFTAYPEQRQKYFLWDLKNGIKEELFKNPNFSPYSFRWLDSNRVLFWEEWSHYEQKRAQGIKKLFILDVKNKLVKEIPLHWNWGGGSILQIYDNSIIASLARGVYDDIVQISENKNGWKVTKLAGKFSSHISSMSSHRKCQKVIFVTSNAMIPPTLQLGIINGKELISIKKLHDPNPFLKNKLLAKRKIIHWKSKGGQTVEGVLFYPVNYEKNKKYPLVVNIHGGPAGHDRDLFWHYFTWVYYPHLLANKGCFSLFVNYSGSDNYGLDWLESIYGHYYEKECEDILSGVGSLIDKGLVNPDKLSLLGWSNGSILSIKLTTITSRFKAALCGAGDVNWTSDYGNCMFGVQFDNLYFLGPPWKYTKHYLEKSPYFQMENVTTPTLIMFGTSDRNVPTEQGWQHFRALERIGKAPVKFILFPGEPHGFRKISHQRRKVSEELSWLNKYLFGKKCPEPLPIKKGSPIDVLLALSKVAKTSQGLYGITKGKTIVPEFVEANGFEASRFEITRAQFACFIKDSKFQSLSLPGFTGQIYLPGTGNYPVTGISEKLALQYCIWLSKEIGRNVVLPTEKWMKKQIKKAAPVQNTLEWWLDYKPTYDDAKKILSKIKQVEKSHLLLLPVGKFAPDSNGLFDIVGNAAELCSAKTGSGTIVIGKCARQTLDEFGDSFEAPPEYIGFRVIIKEENKK